MQPLISRQTTSALSSVCSVLTPPAVRPCRCQSQLQAIQRLSFRCQGRNKAPAWRCSASAPAGVPSVSSEQQVPGMTQFLDSLKYNADGLVAVIVQHVDTGEILMQAFADRAALSETMQTKTCWFSQAQLDSQNGEARVHQGGVHTSDAYVPRTTLLGLEHTIQQRRADMEAKTEGKPSWTSKLLSNPELLCKKVREEAGELCQTLEQNEGKERAASEAADLLYHAMVLLNLQGVPMEDVLRVLRKRFAQSGIEEKAARPAKK